MALLPVAGMKIYIGDVMDDQATDFVEADFTTANASPDAWIWSTAGNRWGRSATAPPISPPSSSTAAEPFIRRAPRTRPR
jgi:hypothetical protein